MKINQISELNIGHYPIKVKFTARLRNVSPFTTIETDKSYISALALDRKL